MKVGTFVIIACVCLLVMGVVDFAISFKSEKKKGEKDEQNE